MSTRGAQALALASLASVILALHPPATFQDGAHTPFDPADMAGYMIVWDDYGVGRHDNGALFLDPSATSVTLPIPCGSGAWRVQVLATTTAQADSDHETGAVGIEAPDVSAPACAPGTPLPPEDFLVTKLDAFTAWKILLESKL